MPKQPTSIRISPSAKELLAAIAIELAVSQSAVIEIAIRELAKKYNVEHPNL